MIISKWSKDDRTAEVVESPVRHFVGWNVDQGRPAVWTETGRIYFDSAKEAEEALREEGWSEESI